MADAILAQSGIYKITNTANGKIYVGSAVKFKTRWNAHLTTLRRKCHENKKLQAAWLKYGEGSLVFSVIEVVTDLSNLVQREQHWIDLLNTFKAGYNMCPTAGNCIGRRFSDESRAKMSASAMGRVMSPETRVKLSASGRAVSREVRDRIAKLNSGQKRTLETRARQSAAQIGKTHSAETKAKLAALAVNMSLEQREKIAASLRGRPRRPHTAESIAKMSASKKEGWARRKAAQANISNTLPGAPNVQ
ncbi:GIY-YIG nuclease family protein [Janthinobacterium sp. DSP2-3-3]|uniref:GIY-YIG nuclease family protein n=1 Tax=Janthinobacterium sp. DSP2-3-3 TaxID=2804596 RepID=UPI003CF61D23